MDAVIIALASGKGGTGNTTSAAFIGGALAGLGRQVALVELAEGQRSVDIIAGVSGQTVFDLDDVLSGRSAPGKALAQSPHHPGLHVISAPYSGGCIEPERVRLLCTRLRPHFDFILLDTRAGLGPAFEAAREACHRMILLATPDPVALRDARQLADHFGRKDAQLRLILNRVDRARLQQDGLLEDLDEAIDLVGVQLLGVIPESTAIARAGGTGSPLKTGSDEAKVFSAIARRITGEDVPLVFS
ncbi:MAG: septum site-determining protein MinD [Ruminococcaceae bacterium]|nr:septum site-determining protein MinD [Oscillospiraceae bacterium]